ncbi:signal peptidase I [Candidatus Daviesbacteria bacterium]|nr:signal peptidase I [Candidatus Daviesbacteria bacterium]
MLAIFKPFLIFLFFPIYLLLENFIFRKDELKRGYKIFTSLLAVFILLPIWIVIYFSAALIIAGQLHFFKEPVAIAGSGSMYPTFPKGVEKDPKVAAKEIVGEYFALPYPTGFNLFGKSFFSYQISHGDIVIFENEKVKAITNTVYGSPSGLIKRVIALPGDSIEIRDGLVILNNKTLEEPYIARARSTFGGEFLPECKKLVIPQDKLFVMGDNRTGSSDSRYDVQLIDFSDITHVIPFDNQKGKLDKNWRDSTNDLLESSKIHLDKFVYLELLNKKRVENGLKPLKYQPKLELSAKLRGEIMLRFDDFSFEASRSGYTMEKALQDVSYSNITWGEIPTQGYFEAEELIEGLFEFPEGKKFLLNPDDEEFGIAQVPGELNGCPTQVIVQHFAGYIPPNYSAKDIESWKSLLKNLQEIKAGWQNLKDLEKFYQEEKIDVDRINEIIQFRLNNVPRIISRMEANEWLTKEELDYIKQDKNLSEEQNQIADKLNKR